MERYEDGEFPIDPFREVDGGEAEDFDAAEEALIEYAERGNGNGAGEEVPRLELIGEEDGDPDLATWGEDDEEELRD
jgi:hypothetical protein